MPPIISAFTRAVTALNRAAFHLAALSIYAIVPVMLIDVVMRYVFNTPTVWAMELAVLIFGPYFLLAGPYVLHLKGSRGHRHHPPAPVAGRRQGDGPGQHARHHRLRRHPALVLLAARRRLVELRRDVRLGSCAARRSGGPKAAVPLSLALVLAQAAAAFLRLLFRDPSYEAVAS